MGETLEFFFCCTKPMLPNMFLITILIFFFKFKILGVVKLTHFFIIMIIINQYF